MRKFACAALLVLAIGCSQPASAAASAAGPGRRSDHDGIARPLTSRCWRRTNSRAARRRRLADRRPQDYLAKQLSALGIEPGAPDGTYFQQVPIVESAVERNFVLSVPGNTYKYLTDVVAFSGVEKPRVQVQGDVVFVGYGINAPELKWNDYDGANVRGKWVMIMVNDPPAPADEPTLFGGTALTYYGRWTYKFEEAARQGAAGALLIHTDESATYPWQVVQIVVERHAVFAAAAGGRARARHQGVDHQCRGEGSRAGAAAATSTPCAPRPASAASRRCR